MSFNKQLLSGEKQACISAMQASILNVLSNSIVQQLTSLCYSIEFNFFRSSDILRDHDWIVTAHNCCRSKETLQLVIGSDDTHGSTTENVRWSDKHWVPCTPAKEEGLIGGCEFRP